MQLALIAGPGTGQTIDIEPGRPVVAGRSSQADICIPSDPELSRRHFALAHDGKVWRIRDLGSSNGTQVNDIPIHETVLQEGDRIAAGGSVFVVRDAATTGDRTARVPVEDVEPPLPDQVLQIDNRTAFSIATTVWEGTDQVPRLSVILKGTFAIATGGAAPWAADQLPVLWADEPYDADPLSTVRLESDMVPFKPRGDVVLVGSAHTPGGQPRTHVDVGLRVGPVRKIVRVIGDRVCKGPTVMLPAVTASPPIPFTVMPLRYERAFGGIDAAAAAYYPQNPVGTGFIAGGASAADGVPMPNLVGPEDDVTDWQFRPRLPAGLGFYGRGWVPRLGYAGTYDDAYRQRRAPAPPEDFSYAVFNGAHPDLQVPGYLRGDEQVTLVNVSPISHLDFRLPGVRPKVTLVRNLPAASPASGSGEAGPPWRTETQVCDDTRLDTLVLMPDDGVFYEVFRTVVVLRSPDIVEVARILVELEHADGD